MTSENMLGKRVSHSRYALMMLVSEVLSTSAIVFWFALTENRKHSKYKSPPRMLRVALRLKNSTLVFWAFFMLAAACTTILMATFVSEHIR